MKTLRISTYAVICRLVLTTTALAHAQAAKHSAKALHASATRTASATTEVRAVASDPKAHLGHLVVTGYVGRATPHKGFILVDNTEFRNEGLACLTVPEPTKIPVVWSGAEPKVKQPVKVAGTMAKTSAGYTFTATQVSNL